MNRSEGLNLVLCRLRPAGRLAREFVAERNGAITIEFIVWLPIIVFWVVFSVTFFDAYSTRIQIAKSTYTIGDVLSRQVEVDDAFLDDLYSLSEKLLYRTGSETALRLSSIQFNNNKASVQWTKAYGRTWLAAEMTQLLELYEADEISGSILLVELYVDWRPLVSVPGFDRSIWSKISATRPRFVSSIVKVE